jgi:hypothetical protein
LTDVQAWQATTAAFAFFPGWTATTARNTFAVTVSGVAFTATPSTCTQNCTYTARIVWSVANDLGTAQLRPCGPVTIVPNTSPTSYATLPVGNVGPTSLVVADIAYTFQPTFFGFLIGNIPMMKSAYVSPRIKNATTLTPAGGVGVNQTCPVSG